MDKTFLGILDNHVQEINNSTDSKNANDILLSTIKLLLSQLDYSSSILSTYEKIEMREFFSSFGNIAQSACDFFQASKEHLDPVALNGKIGSNLETTTKKIIEVNSLIKSIEKTNADLLKKQEELNEKNETFKKMEENISRLKKIEETITDEALNKLKKEHTELDLHFGENSEIAVKLTEYGIPRIDDFSNEVDNLEKKVKSELTRFDGIIKSVLEELEKIKEDIGRRNGTLN